MKTGSTIVTDSYKENSISHQEAGLNVNSNHSGDWQNTLSNDNIFQGNSDKI